MTRHRWRQPTTGLTALGLVLTTAMAVPPTPSPSPGPSASSRTALPSPPAGLPGQEPEKVTLITGDVVSYSTAADGSPRTQVKPARRADGAPVAFISVRERDASYVFPADVMGLVAAGRLDKSLFDVAYLAKNGYTDRESAGLPLIVRYGHARQAAGALSAQADALPATSAPRGLPSVDGAAVRVDKKAAGQFWSAVDSPQTARSGAATFDRGVSSIWLDRRIRVALDRSVPQIGAPEVWATGQKGAGVKVAVLDTGVDLAHPDVAGHVKATANFTDETSVQDGQGHGTHVASIIAGTGAASGGKYTGVAPEASLLVGKVLDNSGTGTASAIIAGMEWAVAQQARVISISVGGCCPSRDDPMNQAVDNLSAQSTSLFVIAAGNDGESRTINTPGAAASALTVGAVDGSDELADFSSRGPVPGDYGLKPDIVAPGVSIVAARAAGTRMGTPVDDRYTSASGTSMATPHVAGAAALLAGAHPDWTGARLKAALIGTARDTGRSAYEQGAGRVDVARAVRQSVHGPGNLDFGFLPYPQTGPVTRTLTYTNDGDQPVTLTLRAGVTAHQGTAPARALSLDRDTVTVPAHGSAPVTVTFDPSGPATWYEGFVHASDESGDVRVNAAVGAFVEPRKVTVRTRMVLPDGATDVTTIPWAILRTDERDDLDIEHYPEPGPEAEVKVYPGTYSVNSAVAWRGGDGEWNISLPTDPQFEVTKDTTVTLDLRRARRVTQRTPRPSEIYTSQYSYERRAANGIGWVRVDSSYPAYGLHNYWLLPTRKITQGTFHVAGQFMRGAPVISMTVREGDRRTLHPRYQDLEPQRPKLDGRRTIPLAYAGHGQAADLAGVDVRGKLVLLDLGDLCPTMICTGDGLDRIQAAAAAGAVGVLGYGAVNRAFLDPAGYWPTYPIPTMSLPAEEGRALAGLLARRPATVQAEGVTNSPYVYSLLFHERDRIPARLDYEVGRRNLYEIANRIHADRPGTAALTWSTTVLTRPGLLLGSWGLSNTRRAQSELTEYVGPVSPDVAWTRETQVGYDEGGDDYDRRRALWATAVDIFPSAGAKTESWGAQPRVPGTPVFTDQVNNSGTTTCFPCRTGDLFLAALPVMDPERNHQEAFTWNANFYSAVGGKDELHLSRDGQEIPLQTGDISGPVMITMPRYALPEGEAEYRLTDTFHTPNPLQRYATDVATTWTFRSKRPTGGMQTPADGLCVGWFYSSALTPCEPVRKLNLRYDAGLGLDNRAPAARPQRITITGYHGSYDRPDAKLTGLKLWATFDDGAHWQPVATARKNATSYTAVIVHPPLAGSTGTVGLRVQATDTEGNTTDQTVARAYGLG
ncbi:MULTISPECIES: S8 family serine peptidase [unclassified Nonomuraea]|uniref:S8 family serine peptidase n=1 Tax=unclassified Nonomuraea TaxID=2593643 RepID=UPI00340E2309